MKTILASLLLFAPFCFPQATSTPVDTVLADSSTSNDLFFMIGSDFDRPGLIPRANYNVGWGHTFEALGKIKIGDEVTVAYTYENGGQHGFFHSAVGDNTSTESVGLMKNFGIPYISDWEQGTWSQTKKVTLYMWPQIGITSIIGGLVVQNRLYGGFSLGGIIHLTNKTSIWLQETYNKVATIPWYTTASIGYTVSW